VIQINPKFEKRDISKMDCDTEDELDIDVVGSDSETEEDQAISDAQERIFIKKKKSYKISPLKMDERSEAKNAKRSFASNYSNL